jgi:DNA helicase-2/ATP-dependent DNA helicase PcrA
MDLTDEQRAIAAHREGPAICVAVAGAAKTTSSLFRIAALVKSGVRPSKILLTTFSRLGASDMRKKALELGVRSGVEFRTIHSIVWGMLKKSFPKKKLPPAWFPRAVIRKVLKKVQNAPPTKEVLSTIGLAKSFMILPDPWETKTGARCPGFIEWAKSKDFDPAYIEAADLAYRKLEEERLDPFFYEWKLKDWKAGEEAFDHDDALVFTAKAILQGDEWTKQHEGRFDHVIVDEFQDTSLVQFVALRHVAKVFERERDGEKLAWRNFLAIGDPEQSIYGWRGAATWLFDDLIDEGPHISFFPLTTNFRSGRRILAAANGILRAANGRLFDGELQLGRKGVEGEINYNAYPNAREEAQGIVDKIKASIAAGRKPAEIAVLYRINASAGLVEMCLIREKIPYRVAGRAFFGRPDVQAAIAYLQLALDHDDQDAYEIAYRVPLKGLGREFLKRFPTYAKLKAASGGEIGPRWGHGARRLMRCVGEIEEILEDEGVVASLRYVFDDAGVRTHFLEDQDSVGEGSEGDSEQADEQQDEAIETLLGCAEAAGTAQGLIDYASDVDRGFGKHDGNGDRAHEDRVTLSTLHRFKGLEKEEVFLLGCTEGLLPLAKADRDEEWRLGYVAFTRAKDVFNVSHASSHGGRTSQPSTLLVAAGVVNQDGRPLPTLPAPVAEPEHPPQQPCPSCVAVGATDYAEHVRHLEEDR